MTDPSPPTVTIEMSAKPVLSYAMAHNRIPVVDSLRLASSSDAEAAVIRVSVSDAHGVVTAPLERVVDLSVDRPTTLNGVTLTGDPGAMLHIEEQRPATVTVEVLLHGSTVATHREPIQLLAARQWLREPPLLSMELLPAFVMPNDPAIASLVDEASQVLETRTASPSLDGYQSGPERVDAIVRALFDAVRARRIRYANPPASWADVGQKIRTPSEVLDGRLGTCLDTVVVLAAAMEQAGVRPLLWLVDGHAFVGYWRQEAALDAIAQSEVSDVVNLIDLGLVRLVETTMVTVSPEAVDFDETARAPYVRYLTGEMDDVLGVIDVWTARRNGIVPLPAHARAQDGSSHVVEYRAAEHSAPRRAPRQADAGDTGGRGHTAAVPPRVQQWKNALLDLSLRNRLINYTDRAGVALHVPDGYLGAVEDILHAREAVHLLPSDHLDEVHVARGAGDGSALPQPRLVEMLTTKRQLFTTQSSAGYATRMQGLAYRARTIVEETGANNLYLALGSLTWAVDGKRLRSPLILVPVKLSTRARSSVYRLELDDSGTSTPNYCLLEKLHQLHPGMRVPGLAEPAGDGAGIDLDAALQAMRVAVAERGLPYRVQATADLAVLQFAKFRLWKDLDEHWETLSRNALVRHLIHTPTDPFDAAESGEPAPVDLDGLDAVCPVPGDESQLRAVADAVAGRTFVLEGPPGTGKSQTITNLLTRAVAEGKRVLFVAEKRAALDVVRGRLEAVGMGPFCLDLHDKGSRPAVVRAQVRAALDHDVAVDEQGLAAQQEDLRSARGTLRRYADRLHEKNAVGLSFYSARTQALALGQGDVLPVPRQFLGLDDPLAVAAEVRNALRTLPDTADAARPAPDHPWGFLAVVDPERLDVEELRAAVLAVDRSVDALPATGPVAEVLRSARTADDLAALASILQAPGVPLTVLDTTRSSGWHEASVGLTHELQAFVAAAHPALDRATPQALDLPLADLHAQAQAAAASSWFGRSKRLKAVLARLAPALRPGVVVKAKTVPELTAALLQLQGAVRALADRASGVPGVAVPATWNPLTEEGQRLVSSQVSWLTWAGRVVDGASAGPAPQGFVTALRRFMSAGQSADPATTSAVQRLGDDLRRLFTVAGTTPADLARWCGDVALLHRWSQTRHQRDIHDPNLLATRRWVAFLARLRPLQAAGLDAARDLLLTGAVPADNASRAFERGLAVASVEERRDATGLDTFDAAAHNRAVRRFTDSSVLVRRQMTTAVPAQVLTRRPFRPSTARGQVGALQRELSRQRGGLGVRALLSTYGDLITQVMPCVLVSPDSLSRFFPVGHRAFDLVVFDEASQIRVADAIGAMGRSTSVVVVGDSKQMPPTSFAESLSGADEDDEVPDALVVPADEESILTECVLARVPRRWLSWHYRSQDESLIAFSNHHYYEGRLCSFPAPSGGRAHAGIGGFGISLVRVEGTFHRSGKGRLLRTNPVEAEAVVAEIRRRFDASPEVVPSIGVVTFNQPQRAYIESLLRDTGDERLVDALDSTEGEGLFIKNLENVQGDERDVILFSTAFSVNERGSLPLNFGPLNRAGGERRLNVAVTRARRQVVIFSSFAPAQLRAEETSSVGIKHLRAYLDLAERGTAAALPAGPRSTASPDRHRQEIAESLRRRGLVVHEELGLSEFKVELGLAASEDPERLLVAVLLDGEGWRRRGTVGDRDGLPIQVLSKVLRWPDVQRVWLPEWLANPEEVVARLEQAVRSAATRPIEVRALEQEPVADPRSQPVAEMSPVDDSSGVSAHGRSAPEVNVPDMALPERTVPVLTSAVGGRSGALPGEEPFVAWSVRSLGAKETLDRLPFTAREVRRLIEEIVACEGPIHHDRLAKLVGSAYGLSRVTAGRVRVIVEQIPAPLNPDPTEPFAWPPACRPDVWTGFRRSSSDHPRAIETVSLREIGNAMVAISTVCFGIQREELMREALAVFGGRRLTTSIHSRLTEALIRCLADGRLAERDGLLVAP